MPTITLPEPWTYRTPMRTIDFAAGKHTVDDAVAEAATAAGVVKESENVESTKPRKGAAADDAESE